MGRKPMTGPQRRATNRLMPARGPAPQGGRRESFLARVAAACRPVRSAGFALLVLSVALVVLLPGSGSVAEAQRFDPFLVANMGGNKVDASLNPALAQTFTTGDNATGYILTEIQMESNDAEGDDFTMHVCEVDTNTHPTSTCWELTPPTSFARGRLTFTAPGGLHLNAGATYSVVLRNIGTEVADIWSTSVTPEDTGSLSGWSIGDRMHVENNGTWKDASSQEIVRLSIRGEANEDGAPTVQQPGTERYR